MVKQQLQSHLTMNTREKTLKSPHRFQVPPPGCDHVFIEGLPVLLGHLQSVPQLLDLLSVTLTHRLVLRLAFLQLQDQQDTKFHQSPAQLLEL